MEDNADCFAGDRNSCSAFLRQNPFCFGSAGQAAFKVRRCYFCIYFPVLIQFESFGYCGASVKYTVVRNIWESCGELTNSMNFQHKHCHKDRCG